MKKLYSNIIESIGKYATVENRRLNPNPKVKIYAKLESFNPGGSIKDRTALYMISEAEKRGELTPDKIILEATSGNTGIGLALIAAAKGYRLCLAMAESASEERKKILKALGAELYFTPAGMGTDGAIEEVYSMMRENPDRYFVPDQFNNPDNILAHYYGTAEEIWQQTDGKVTTVIATMGTTGTAMGLSRRLKEHNPEVRVVGVEPYLQHRIQGLKNLKESYVPGIFDKQRLDEKVHIQDEDAYETARRLAREEGILAGMSSGAAMYVAMQKAREMDEGFIVVIFPDSGERYLSTELFMDKEESTIRFYNVLSRSKTFFRPINPEMVLMHSCGPTIHEVPHIGSYRRFVVSDLIRRYLEFRGYPVKHVLNIIDLADRSIRGAERENTDLAVYTARCADAFLRDIEKLGIKKDENYPRASENFDCMLELVDELVERGFAYEKLRSVYFDISKLRDYGCLSNVDLTRVQHGRTIDLDYYEKDSPVDFTLLKRSTLSELKRGVFFKTRWGNVRPSWHLECAAIARHYLAETFDIHASGSDIIFPHCENVMAIGKAATGRKIANYWINTDLVMVGGKKMSRSLNNALTLEDLEKKGYSGREVRFFLFSSHYRKPLNFSFGALDTAKYTVLKLNGFIQRLIRFKAGSGYPELEQSLYDLRQGFIGAMDDDLNISGALAALFAFVKKVSVPLAGGLLTLEQRDSVLEAMKKVDSVFGVMKFEEEQISGEARRLMKEREALRAAGRWAQADEIRQKLLEMGVVVADTPEGMVWRLK
jgi:cysteinyl-tRNA synthetase